MIPANLTVAELRMFSRGLWHAHDQLISMNCPLEARMVAREIVKVTEEIFLLTGTRPPSHPDDSGGGPHLD